MHQNLPFRAQKSKNFHPTPSAPWSSRLRRSTLAPSALVPPKLQHKSPPLVTVSLMKNGYSTGWRLALRRRELDRVPDARWLGTGRQSPETSTVRSVPPCRWGRDAGRLSTAPTPPWSSFRSGWLWPAGGQHRRVCSWPVAQWTCTDGDCLVGGPRIPYTDISQSSVSNCARIVKSQGGIASTTELPSEMFGWWWWCAMI